jgi:hypothetical protein
VSREPQAYEAEDTGADGMVASDVEVRASRVPTTEAREHGPACPCTRCQGFEKGNGHALIHGARSVVALEPRAAEIADEVRGLVPASSPSDEPSIRLLALALAQVEAATVWLAENGIVDETGNARNLLKHLGTMMNTAARIAANVGMTPTSRAALGVDVARTHDVLGEYLRARNGGDA